MSTDYKKFFGNMLSLGGLPDSQPVKLNPRAFLSRLDADETRAIEEASQASELSDAFEKWANAGGARDTFQNNVASISARDVDFILACRAIMEKMIEREQKREEECFEEHG